MPASKLKKTTYGKKWNYKKQRTIQTGAARGLKNAVRYYTRHLATGSGLGPSPSLAKKPANAKRRRVRAKQLKAMRKNKKVTGGFGGIASISRHYHGGSTKQTHLRIP